MKGVNIKFRGLRINHKSMVFGDLIHGVGTKKDKIFILPIHTNLATLEGCHPLDGYEINEKSLGQQTPFKDIKAKDIYDGDILGDWSEVDGKMVQSANVVYFCEKDGMWMLDSSYYQDRSCAYNLAQELRDFKYEVIGNIYQNPELLNNKN